MVYIIILKKQIAIFHCAYCKRRLSFTWNISVINCSKYTLQQEETNSLTFPPEWLRSNYYTTASDIWGIGFTLWEIFLGGKY